MGSKYTDSEISLISNINLDINRFHIKNFEFNQLKYENSLSEIKF